MGPGAMILVHTSSFITTGSGIQKLLGGIHIQTHRQQDDFISLLLFLQNKESRLKMNKINKNLVKVAASKGASISGQ
jgi:hypothetical protein